MAIEVRDFTSTGLILPEVDLPSEELNDDVLESVEEFLRQQRTAFGRQTLRELELTAAMRLREAIPGLLRRGAMPHQIRAIQSVGQAFENGERAVLIEAPPGAGKTAIGAFILESLDMSGLILTPSLQIADQTRETYRKRTPSVPFGTYNSSRREYGTRVLNTTYQSLPALLNRGLLRLQDLEITVFDEVDESIGFRHESFKYMPGLLIGMTATPELSKLERYQAQGLIGPDEDWVGILNNPVYRLSLDRAIKSGISVDHIPHILKVKARAKAKKGPVGLNSDGEYNLEELRQKVDIKALNFLARALISGTQVLPEGFKLTHAERKFLETEHQRVAGRRMVLFGYTIKHIKYLSHQISEDGITAVPIHGLTPSQLRTGILEQHAAGRIPIVSSVDALGRGWDSPSTEVVVDLVPTRSFRKLLQKHGRAFRPSKKTGKEIADLYQIIPEFQEGNEPYLITQLKQPYHSTRVPSLTTIHGRASSPEYDPLDGVDIEVSFDLADEEEVNIGDEEKILEAGQKLDEILSQVLEENPNMPVLEYYQTVASRIAVELDQRLLPDCYLALRSVDADTYRLARKVVIFSELQTVLDSLDTLLVQNPNSSDDIIQDTLLNLLEEHTRLSKGATDESFFEDLVFKKATEFISEIEGMPKEWVKSGKYKQISETVTSRLRGDNRLIDEDGMIDLSEELAIKTQLEQAQILDYIKLRMLGVFDEEEVEEGETAILKPAIWAQYAPFLAEAMTHIGGIKGREKIAVNLAYGFSGEAPLTDEQIAKEFGVPLWRAQLIRGRAVNKMREWYMKKVDKSLKWRFFPIPSH